MSAPHENAGGTSHKPPDNGHTGLPGLQTWPRVYGFVLGCFVLWMVLLWGLGILFR
jgi:hypothetical protein